MSAKAEKIIREESEAPAEVRHLETLAELEDDYERLRYELGDLAADDPECETARLKLELARSEYDRAGAIKFKGFVRRHREMFVSAEGKALVEAKETEEGRVFVASEEALDRRYLIINLGELDRLNKEGHSQSAGDVGLESVVHAAERAARGRFPDMSIFRYGSNEYLLEFPDIGEIDLQIFKRALFKEKLDLRGYDDLEAPPLSVTDTSLAEIVDIMNTAAIASPELEGKDAHEAATESVSILRRFADYDLEREKFVTRVNRAIAKLQEAKDGKIQYGDAKAFFDTYLKKAFFDSDIGTLEDIQDLWQEGADPADFARAVDLMAVAAAKKRFAEDRQFELYERHLASGLVRDYLKAVGSAESAPTPLASALGKDVKLARIPDPRYGTEGLRVLSRKREAIGRRGDEWKKVEELEFSVEEAKRDLSTGLLERGQFYEDLEKRIADGKETSLIFVDLGFLKYFNDAGRRAVGDAALLKAAEVMEEALMENEIDGKVYRYGGDEFTVVIEGGREDAEHIRSEIERLRKEAGRIPDLRSLREQGRAADTTGDSRPDYAPMELVLNYGIADTKSVIELLGDIGGEEIDKMLGNSRRGFEALVSDILVKMADAGVGYQKAVSRFHDLLDLMKEEKYADPNSPEHKRTESIIAASRKAIFAGLGGEAALRFWAEGQEHEKPAILSAQIERFVSDRIEKMEAILESEKGLVDKLVEIHASRNRLIGELEEMQEKLSGRDRLLKSEEEKIRALQVRLAEAETARKEIVEQRKSIREVAIDKMAKM